MRHKFLLPEPSGDVQWMGHLKNSYGGMGCYRVGLNEVENPTEDVEFYSQLLADSLLALEFENTEKVDRLASLARDTYYGLNEEGLKGWANLSEEFKDRWRAAIRVVLMHVG